MGEVKDSLNPRGEYPREIAVFGMHNSLGDNAIILKALYALKALYPKAKLTILSNGSIAESLFKHIIFIDEIINIQKTKLTKGFDVLLLVIKHNRLESINQAKQIRAKQRLTIFSKSLLLQKGIFFIPKFKRVLNPYWKQRHHISDGALWLVRAINKRHFDKEICKIDFKKAEIPRSSENIAFVESALKRLEYQKYQKRIGICPFGNNTKILRFNFPLEAWIRITEELARRFPQNLFIFMDYPQSEAKFPSFAQKNIVIFKNNEDLLNLVEFISRLDLLLSVDTGCVHIADNLRIPTLELIRDFLQNKWAGGSYGGICECVCLPKNWQINPKQYQDSFVRLAREMLESKIL